VVICHAGVRSWHFGCWLLSRDPHRSVWNLSGGIDAWSVTVDPRVPRY
jgi:rhodanese-related sulfurtransferase